MAPFQEKATKLIMARGFSLIAILFATCFALAAGLERAQQNKPGAESAGGVLEILLGDTRRVFANQSFIKADVYFHDGYYPTIFDQQPSKEPSHMVELGTGEHSAEEERKSEFLGKPRDWIDGFGRHFFPSAHAHADETGDTREILPWLRLSAKLDPHRVETYVVASYWLRTRINKPDEALEILREGWRENPDSHAILFELGRLYYENRHDPDRARNLWELALKKLLKREQAKAELDNLAFLQITIHLALLEGKTNHLDKAIEYLDMARARSPNPQGLQRQIEELKARRGSGSG